jgi:hypothetical protein
MGSRELTIACGTDDACDGCGISAIQDPMRRKQCADAAQLLIDSVGLDVVAERGDGIQLDLAVLGSLRTATGTEAYFELDMVRAVGSSVGLVARGVCYEELDAE